MLSFPNQLNCSLLRLASMFCPLMTELYAFTLMLTSNFFENVFFTVSGRKRFVASLRDPSGDAGSAVQFVFAGDAAGLARHPAMFRYRYQVP